MEKFFKLKEHGTTVRTEIIAGLTTFLAMAYILAVNPGMLAMTGMDQNAVFLATACSAAIATLCMGVFANYPVALASGMGLNAFFTFSICLNEKVGASWRVALTAVLVEGIVFIVLSLFKFRETLVNEVPANLKYGITAGIGLFIAIIGFKGAGIIVADGATLVTLGSFASPQFALAIIGLIVIAILHSYNVKGSILIGILVTWVLGMIAQATGWYVVNIEAGVYSLYPNFANWTPLPQIKESTLFQFDFAWVAKNGFEFAVLVFSFLFVDLFDTVGTLIGVASKAKLLDKNGKLPRAGAALMADAVGTVIGACVGTSTVTSYVESTAGVSEGGRTGLTAVTTAVLFLLSIFLYPIFTAIPGFATAPALIFVGILMIGAVKNMHFEGDMADVVGGFLAITMMPFTYSISNGIMFAMISWVVIKIFTGKLKDIHPIMWISAGLFAIRVVTLVMGL